MRAVAAIGFALLAWLAAPVAAGAAGFAEILPWLVRFEGGLKGVYAPVPDRPLRWSVQWHRLSESVREGELLVDGVDVSVRVRLIHDASGRRLAWRVIEGRLNLGSWLPALARRPELAGMLDGLEVVGDLRIEGEGALEGEELLGELNASLVGAALRHSEQGWSLEGVDVRIGGDAATLAAGRVPVEVAVRTITTGRFGARALGVKAVLVDFDRAEVERAGVEIAGGRVDARPFSVSLVGPSLDVKIDMRRVGLQDLVVFAPTAFSEASGKIDGRLELKWSEADGVRLGVGRLSLSDEEPTMVRMVESPGFLTESMPARFVFLPPSFGVFSRWFSARNDAYDDLGEIEKGKVRLRLEALDVRLTPDGDERGKSATVFIRARPEQDGLAVGTVTFQINVSGPLSQVLRLGINRDFSLQSR